MWADQALERVLREKDLKRVLDIGSGAGHHAKRMRDAGMQVTTVSLCPPADWVGDYMQYYSGEQFDCIWASHVLEHQPDVGSFLYKCFQELRDDGLLAVTVPPKKDEIVGGHLTLWNAGLLVYNVVVAGFDCREAAVGEYGYNISLLVRKRPRPPVDLKCDAGDITLLAEYFPFPVFEGFLGVGVSARW